MAYVDGFEHDIFLSYARVDDQTAADAGAGWVTAFEKRLQVALDRRVGRIGVVRIWRDLRRIQGHQLFDRTIEDAVNASSSEGAAACSPGREPRVSLRSGTSIRP